MSELQGRAPDRVTVPRRRPWLSALIYLVVFVSGLVCGAGMTAVGIRRHLQRVVRHPDLAVEDLSRYLNARLHLTAAQRAQIGDIVRKHRQALQEIRRNVQPQVQREFRDLAREIEQVLDARQQQTWRRMTRRMQHWAPAGPERAEGRDRGGAKAAPP